MWRRSVARMLCMLIEPRYALLRGDELWINDVANPERPRPLFRLQPHDERYARRLLNALNASNPRRLRPNPPGLTALQRMLDEVRRVCDLAVEELSVRERAEFLSIVTSLVA